jgi:hypothetical protein
MGVKVSAIEEGKEQKNPLLELAIYIFGKDIV